jgi:hypothetical protein
MATQITLGQVKQIALEVSKSYELINRGTYFNCIDRKTRQSSLEGGRSNLVYAHLCGVVRSMYLSFIESDGNYFDWQLFGVQESNNRKEYLMKVEQKVVELLCGFKYQSIK